MRNSEGLRPDEGPRASAMYLRVVECCQCTHVWNDTPGITAQAFVTGCPRCGSVYFRDCGLYVGPANRPLACTVTLPEGH